MIKDHIHIISFSHYKLCCGLPHLMISIIAMNLNISIHCYCHENVYLQLFLLHSEAGQHFYQIIAMNNFYLLEAAWSSAR